MTTPKNNPDKGQSAKPPTKKQPTEGQPKKAPGKDKRSQD